MFAGAENGLKRLTLLSAFKILRGFYRMICDGIPG